MKRKLNPDFSNRRSSTASVDQVNRNEYQLICIGDLVQIYKKKEFYWGKTYNTGTFDIILYIKHFCDNISVGGWGQKIWNLQYPQNKHG